MRLNQTWYTRRSHLWVSSCLYPRWQVKLGTVFWLKFREVLDTASEQRCMTPARGPHLAINSSDELVELPQWSCRDDSTINIAVYYATTVEGKRILHRQLHPSHASLSPLSVLLSWREIPNWTSIQHKLAGWPAVLTASTFKQWCHYASSPCN